MKLLDDIRSARTKKKISQQEMADVLDITQGAYHSIENGNDIKVSQLEKIAKKLEMTASELLEDTENNKSCNIQTGKHLKYENN